MSAQRIFSLLKFCLWFGGIISVTEAESLAGISGAQHPPDGRLAEFLFFRRRRNPKLNRAHQSTWGHNCKNELKELAISNKFERAAAEIDAFSNKSLIDEIDQHENYEVLLDSGMHENGDREEEQAARRFRSQMRKMTETQLLVIEKAFFKCDIAVEKLFGILSWPLLFLTAATFTNIIFSVYNYTVAAITVSENSNLTLMMVYLSIASSSCLMLLIVHDPVEVYQDSTNCVLHITGRPRPLSLAKFCSLGRSSLVSILAFILSSVFVALQFRSPASEASPTAVNTQNSVPSNRT
ncbi:hypothetical protein FHG87_003790 [Trinorchestia longiramus]|nr:hypothetical protein FHG87_003790 [Trinorchestia longiramus]